MPYPALKLPPIQARLEVRDGQELIFDEIRKKFLILTPEEWVRQHFLHLLINHLNYPRGLFQVERQHTYAQSAKRSDIVVLNKSGAPFLLVECKACDVRINQQTLEQIALYNKTLAAEYIAVTNGLEHFIWKKNEDGYLQLDRFPTYSA